MNQNDRRERGDIFDRLMRLPLLRLFEPFYKKHKEGLLYLFFGGVTTLVSFFVFWLCESPLGIDPLLSNLISWVIAVAVAYITNRIWVFTAHASGARAVSLEILSFYLSRVATFLVEEAIILIFVTWLMLPAMPVKIAASVIVVILNYVLSKIFVFRKKKETAAKEEDGNP
ncbi:MAG: GtrA family protein [Clostridia bacterium]|nr:GtrA family protein [Clostridia bacterium]